MKLIDVVYLLHESDSDGPVKEFCKKYKYYIKNNFYNLVFLIKGNVDCSLILEIKYLLENLNYNLVYISNIGKDIYSYCNWAKLSKNNYCIFFNGHSYPLVDNWISLLSMNVNDTNIGIKGATGSLASHSSIFLINKNKINLTYYIKYLFLLCLFKKFPNYHIRTNAFCVKTSLINNWFYRILSLTKIGCYYVESGRFSLTNRALRKNLTAEIVDMSGVHYDESTASISECFFKGNQNRLIVADNQTDKYMFASTNEKKILNKIVWGDCE